MTDSGTASIEMKFNVICSSLIWFFFLCFIISPGIFVLTCVLIVFTFDLAVSRSLIKAFFREKGLAFGIKATLYYSLVYPLAVAAGGAAGLVWFVSGHKGRAINVFSLPSHQLHHDKRAADPPHLLHNARCNARCPYCFYLRSDDDQINSDQDPSLDEIRKISLSFGELLWLAFSGGEIYLRDDLPEISRVFYKNNRPAIMLFPTNGLLPDRIREMTRQILQDCPNSTVAVKLSLDGIDESHDRLRNTPGSFSKTMETYQQLKNLLDAFPNFELGVNTVFCSDNQDRMDEIIDFVSAMDVVKTHTISLIRGNLSDKGFKDVDQQKYQHAIKRLEQNLKHRGSAKTYRFRGARIKAAQDILQRNLISRTNAAQKRLIACYAAAIKCLRN